MSKVDLIQKWLKAGGQVEIDYDPGTSLFYAVFNEDSPPFDRDACGSGETPLEALENLIEDVNEPREA